MPVQASAALVEKKRGGGDHRGELLGEWAGGHRVCSGKLDPDRELVGRDADGLRI